MVSEKNLGRAVIGVLTGTTASGKTQTALELASQCKTPVEVINADSLLVYREMNIGTAKPSPEDLKRLPHHLIDIRNPDQPFTAGEFFRESERVIDEIIRRGNRPLIVGGTGFYLKALLFGLWQSAPSNPQFKEVLAEKTDEELYSLLFEIDPQSCRKIGPADRYRLVRALEIYQTTRKTPSQLQESHANQPRAGFKLWVLDRKNEDLFSRIRIRTDKMLEDGWIDEVKGLIERYPGSRALRSIGYAQICDSLGGRMPAGRKIQAGKAGLSEEIQLATRQLVKSQRTWFRGQFRTMKDQLKQFSLNEDRALLEEEFKSVYE